MFLCYSGTICRQVADDDSYGTQQLGDSSTFFSSQLLYIFAVFLCMLSETSNPYSIYNGRHYTWGMQPYWNCNSQQMNSTYPIPTVSPVSELAISHPTCYMSSNGPKESQLPLCNLFIVNPLQVFNL